MSMFDSIVNEANGKFNLGGKAGTLLSALLALMTDRNRGGLAGFMENFDRAGLGATASSWISSDANTPISNEQLESALGSATLDNFANQAGTDYQTATAATAYMVPHVIDELTPEGIIPHENDLLSRAGGYLTGGSVAGASVAESFDRIGTSAASDNLSAASNRTGISSGNFDERLEEDNSPLRWLMPLILLGILLTLGYWFCGKSPEPPVAKPVATNANIKTNSNVAVVVSNSTTARNVNSSFSIKADNGKYVVSGVVPDEATKKQITDALTTQYGAANVDFSGLRVEAGTKPFGANWWENFSKMLPTLKDWKTGELGFTGNTISVASGLPQAGVDQLKSLFGNGWRLPVSIAGAETASKQANEEALKELSTARTVDQVVSALNLSIINFASGKSDVPADAEPVLQKAAEVLKSQPDTTRIEVGGYTDSDGDDAANVKLSEARANSVMKELVKLGVKAEMLSAKGYGEANPVAPNDTEDNKFRNRRIEYKVGGNSGSLTSTTTETTTNTNTANK
jgi:OOP family OmpA-OmpF porin